ncbi:(4Fe-4S)-binding protein, partial [Chloroflexota bacterium]
GACSYLCPEDAIREENREIGMVGTGQANGLDFVQGRLSIGEAMSPPLVRKVKEHIDPRGTSIIDVPPGTSCPAVESVENSGFCLLVTEPTPFGLNDLVPAVEMTRKLSIPCGVVINRAGAGDYGKVEEYCYGEGVPIMLTIPLDAEIARLYARGIPLIEGIPSWRDRLLGLLDGARERMNAD